MRTYDVHQHLWPSAFVEALRGRRRPPLLADGELVTQEGRFRIDLRAHDPAERLRMLDRDGIDVAVLSLQASLGLEDLAGDERAALEDSWAEGTREIVEAGGGRFLAFSPSHVRDGFVGVSVGASTLLENGAAAEALTAAAEREIPVFVHPDAPRGLDPERPEWWQWVTGYPARMQAAYLAWLAFGRDRWPTLRILFAMLAGGGPFQLERLARRGVDVRSALDANAFFEVSTHGRRAIELCIETFGVTQLAYGSDVPVVDPRPTLHAVRGFGDAVAHVLQSETPGALLT
ncbi:MAG TPA: hypothetical protein VI503_06275 [Gaiellaceae bacterium]|nr:hypothetical protein [Gaiellaceae bacterium]